MNAVLLQISISIILPISNVVLRHSLEENQVCVYVCVCVKTANHNFVKSIFNNSNRNEKLSVKIILREKPQMRTQMKELGPVIEISKSTVD